MSFDGVIWGVVGKSVEVNNIVDNFEFLFKWVKENDVLVFVLFYYYYLYDYGWEIEGVLEVLMYKIGMFDWKDLLFLDGFEGLGVDWMF